ncbi:MAG: M64 family metallopeptidase [Planctomycetota bacterium]
MAAQTGEEGVPVGFETVYFDEADRSGRLSGGRTLLPAAVDPESIAPTPAPWVTLTAGAGLAQRGSGGDNRVDLVFVGDGYTAAEQITFQTHVDDIVAGLFSTEPLGRYADYFAVHRIEVVSNESGVDNDPIDGIDRDTALGMSYWCNGIERLLCVNVGAAYSFANNAPDVDQVIALANSTKYGGAGYTTSNLATSSGGNGAAVEIVKHELGHSLGKLADEYTYGGPTTYVGGEPNRANVSTYDAATMAGLGAKWASWLGASAAGFDGVIDTYEGGSYSELGIYRPSNDSLMRSLNRPFNLVGAEEVIRELYREVRPIDASSDPAAAYSDADVLFVQPMAVAGTPHSVQWFLNGAPIAGATGTTLDLASLGLGGCIAEVSVTVRDETPWVRDEDLRDASMTQSISFTVNGTWVSPSCATTPNSVGSGAVLDAGGSPSIADADLRLGVFGGPPAASALFFYGDTPVSQPLGEGTLCVSGVTQRLGVTSFDALGIAGWTLDWSAPPVGAGPNAILPGSTWIFQAWYRDAGAGGTATFDFSSAVSVRFCP